MQSVQQENFRDINNIMTTCLREITNIELIKKKALMDDDVLVAMMLKYKREDVEEEKR